MKQEVKIELYKGEDMNKKKSYPELMYKIMVLS